jgi:hypothetical protein
MNKERRSPDRRIKKKRPGAFRTAVGDLRIGLNPGSTRVSRVGCDVSSQQFFGRKFRDGGTPSPAPGTGALPSIGEQGAAIFRIAESKKKALGKAPLLEISC